MSKRTIWRAAAVFALAMPTLSGVTAGAALAAGKLRVGTVQAQPFTFAPLDIDTPAQSFVERGTLPTKPDLTKVITEKYLPGAPR